MVYGQHTYMPPATLGSAEFGFTSPSVVKHVLKHSLIVDTIIGTHPHKLSVQLLLRLHLK